LIFLLGSAAPFYAFFPRKESVFNYLCTCVNIAILLGHIAILLGHIAILLGHIAILLGHIAILLGHIAILLGHIAICIDATRDCTLPI